MRDEIGKQGAAIGQRKSTDETGRKDPGSQIPSSQKITNTRFQEGTAKPVPAWRLQLVTVWDGRASERIVDVLARYPLEEHAAAAGRSL